jgi:hypothetical protein
MLNGAKFTWTLRRGLWAECARTATLYENMIVSANKPTPSYNQLYGKEAPYARNLRTFGEVGIVSDYEKIREKLSDRGKECIFVGYAMDHAADVYRMYNISTRRIWESRDIIWMNMAYGDYTRLDAPAVIEEAENKDNDDDDDDEVESEPRTEETQEASSEETAQDSNNQQNPRLIREMRKLSGWFNPQATEIVDNAERQDRAIESFAERMNSDPTDDESGRETSNAMIEDLCAGFSFFCGAQVLGKAEDLSEICPQYNPTINDTVNSENNEPTTFREAWDHPNPEKRAKWQEAIQKEFTDMTRRGVWRKMKRSEIPVERRCIKSKWVFNVKRNNVYQARHAACGYSQIP